MLERLSARERDVAEFLVEGVSNKEIVGALDIEVVTVKRHVGNILRKLEIPEPNPSGPHPQRIVRSPDLQSRAAQGI